MSRMDEKGQNNMTPLHYAARLINLYICIVVFPLPTNIIIRYGNVDKEVGRFAFREDAEEKLRQGNNMVDISSLNLSLFSLQDTL